MAYRPEPSKKKKKRKPVRRTVPIVRPFRESGGPPVPGAGGGDIGAGLGAPPPPSTFKAAGPIDFNAILAQDPYYQAFLANSNAQGVADLADRNAKIREGFIRFGGGNIPTAGNVDLNEILDPTTRSLAEQNTTAGLSILARLADAAQTAKRRTLNSLGARGAYRSGETGFALANLSKQQDIAQYDARNNFLDYVAGVQAAYVESERQRQALLAQQQQDAAQREADNPDTVQQAAGPAVIDNVLPPNYWNPPPAPPKPAPKPPPKKKAPPRYNRPGFQGGK